ncbi:apolipoprotein N-acyltransferase [Gammaproteobacteria bacterium AS21]
MKKKALLALLSGAATTLAFAPFNLFACALITPAILYLLLKNQNVKQACLLGWLYGLGFFGTGVSWVYVSIHTYGYTHPIVAATLTLLFCAALAILFLLQAWLYQKYFSAIHSALSFGVIWLLFEWLRSWLFTGFPWLYLGYSTLDTPLSVYAVIGGVWLNSALVIVISLSLAMIVVKRSTRQLVISVSLITLIIGTSFVIPTQWTHSSGAKIDIAIVQPDIAQQTKWQGNQLGNIVERYYQMSKPLIGNNVIIWPETAIPSFYQNVDGFFAPLVTAQQQQGGSIISGLPMQEPDNNHPDGRRIHNSILNMTQGSYYHKQRLVPFGEYVPFQAEFRDLFNFLNIPELTFSIPEVKNQPLLSVGDYHYSTAICYEIAYPELVRQYSKTADIILTVSNDTWFSHSIGPDQHFQIARMRAVENGRWLIRSANNGITAVVDAQGKVVDIAPRYTQAVLKSSVQPLQGLTPYQRLGVWPLLAGYFAFLLWVLVRRKIEITKKAKQ